jgi:caffeoyl-CoA O-methyltransferase
MPFATALVATDRASRYAKQLVSHFAHKVDVRQDGDGRSVITFERGSCVVNANSQYLELIAISTDLEGLAAVEDVAARHLVRFATKDELEVVWSPPAAGDDVEPVHAVATDYVLAHSEQPDALLRELAVETREATAGYASMQISHDEGALLTMLVRLVGARTAVEVGTFTGYSSICIARGLAAGGRLIACDVSEEWTAIARKYWRRAGVADQIELRIGDAVDTLRAMPDDLEIDFAFIDADKTSYPTYYEEIVRRMRPGGVIALDNVFQGGRVFDPAFQESSPVAVRRLNDALVTDDRVDVVMLPVRDGVTVLRKR